MDWYKLFRQHILDRGIEYYEDGEVTEFSYSNNEIKASVNGSDIYEVEISLDEEDVVDMYCSCPHAAGGHNCKHMAAVLFKFEEMLAEQDRQNPYENGINIGKVDFCEGFNKRKTEVIELVAQIPEEKVRELLVGFVLEDEALKNQLQMQYAFKMNSKLMLELRNELDKIEYRYCRAGYVDWQHASDFTDELCDFLDSKISFLIEKGCLKQAFELTNSTFFCIGNVDMDDSDGSSSYVLERCYEYWKQMAEIGDDDFKKQMKLWFESHRIGYVLDYMDEYIEELLFECFASKEMILDEIQNLDEMIDKCPGNDCGRCYSVYRGCENPILKRLEYMKKLNCSEDEIADYRKNNRRFFVVRELEISEAINEGNYEKAIEVLLESKKLDKGNKEQLKKYSKQLIDIYRNIGKMEPFCKETIFYLESFWQYDLAYVNALKPHIQDKEEWSKIIDGIVEKNTHGDFVCNLLSAEKRYEQLMSKIENSFDKVRLLDVHEKALRKKYPDRVIKIYKDYLKQTAEVANQREKYKGLIVYLKRISKCSGGDQVAKEIAEEWRRVYKRRTAMMDEMRKIGF